MGHSCHCSVDVSRHSANWDRIGRSSRRCSATNTRPPSGVRSDTWSTGQSNNRFIGLKISVFGTGIAEDWTDAGASEIAATRQHNSAINRAEVRLGWHPAIWLDEGLERTIAGFKTRLNT